MKPIASLLVLLTLTIGGSYLSMIGALGVMLNQSPMDFLNLLVGVVVLSALVISYKAEGNIKNNSARIVQSN